jgi:hypothetical protein
MKYLRTNLATDWEEGSSIFQKVVDFAFSWAQSNPGYEEKLHLVREWLIEFDDEGLPWREIGLGSRGDPVLAGPSEENYGFWLDTNMSMSDFEGVEIASAEFEKLWKESGVTVVT